MGGLEQIVRDILSEAERECESIEKDIETQIDAVKADCEAKKAALELEMTKKTQEECMKISDRFTSEAEAAARELILEAKQRTIQNVLSDIKQSIKEAPDSEYFDFLAELSRTHIGEGNGVLYLCERDLARVPFGFCEKIGQRGEITLSDKPGDLDAGFILRRGKIDINCSLDSIFEEKKNELCDLVNKLFFVKG